MSTDPFIERLREHASSSGIEPAVPISAAPATSAPPRPRVAADQLSFWQSRVAQEALNQRITGDGGLAPETYFARRYAGSLPAPLALSLRGGDPRFEVALVAEGTCTRVVGLDSDADRVAATNLRVPRPLRTQIAFRCSSLEAWTPDSLLGAVAARSVLHRQSGLEETLDRVRGMLAPAGLLFVDDFVGPARFQWSDAQLEIVNRLLACMPDDLLTDLTAADGRRKRSVGRPDAAGFAAAHPAEAVRSDEILACLDARFERVEVRPYGGAIYHQLFTRIMGNFAERPDLVRVLMEVDALLTEAGAVASDYVWGVWRRP